LGFVAGETRDGNPLPGWRAVARLYL